MTSFRIDPMDTRSWDVIATWPTASPRVRSLGVRRCIEATAKLVGIEIRPMSVAEKEQWDHWWPKHPGDPP